MQGASPPSVGDTAAPMPARAAVAYQRPSGERAKLVIAIIGLAVSSLLFLLILGYLGPIIQMIYNLWGLLGMLLLLAAIIGFFVALLFFFLRGKRAEPYYEAPTTIDALQTKQS